MRRCVTNTRESASYGRAVDRATNYLVIQYQTFLAQAQSTEVAAKGAYAKAKVALDRAAANTLEVNQVSIQEAQDGRVSRQSAPILHP